MQMDIRNNILRVCLCSINLFVATEKELLLICQLGTVSFTLFIFARKIDDSPVTHTHTPPQRKSVLLATCWNPPCKYRAEAGVRLTPVSAMLRRLRRNPCVRWKSVYQTSACDGERSLRSVRILRSVRMEDCRWDGRLKLAAPSCGKVLVRFPATSASDEGKNNKTKKYRVLNVGSKTVRLWKVIILLLFWILQVSFMLHAIHLFSNVYLFLFFLQVYFFNLY